MFCLFHCNDAFSLFSTVKKKQEVNRKGFYGSYDKISLLGKPTEMKFISYSLDIKWRNSLCEIRILSIFILLIDVPFISSRSVIKYRITVHCKWMCCISKVLRVPLDVFLRAPFKTRLWFVYYIKSYTTSESYWFG